MLTLSDDNEIFRGYTTTIELYNALRLINMLFFIQNILTFNLGVAFLKSVSILIYVAKTKALISPAVNTAYVFAYACLTRDRLFKVSKYR